MPLIKTKVTDVQQGQRFHYAGRAYVLATAEEERKHPADSRIAVLAYSVPERGNRVPVSFNGGISVFCQKK